MSELETVYAVHNFEAENDDELTFQIGETVVVIQKDDGFGDGWWKGKNMRGEVGLFPMNYISFQPCDTPSISDTMTTRSSLHSLDTTQHNENQFEVTSPSARSSYSFTCPTTSTASTQSHPSNNNNNTNQLRRMVVSSLFLPTLRSKTPEEWDVDQVEIWLNAMNFGSIAANFKSQEITGDILLELNMGALKELDVPTYGKRFKVHNALNALREECGHQITVLPPTHRLSIASSTLSEEPSRTSLQSPTSPKSANSPASQPTMKHQKKNQVSKTALDETECVESASDSDALMISPTSNYDIMEASIQNYESERRSNVSHHDNLKQLAQNHHTVIPMAHRNSTDNYSLREEIGNATPDMEGWLHKQGCKYKKWNKRWFVLKGPNLFYFKSPKDVRMKGIINLRGYRIVPDETIQPGKYSFKAQHEEERTFYFYTELDTSMKSWMSSLMKATISRDFNAPVLSSSMIPTVSLDVARRMRPRPPSALLYRKENRKNSTSLPLTVTNAPASTSSSSSSYSSKPKENQVVSKDRDDEELTNQDSGFDSDPQQSTEDTSNQVNGETEPFEYDDEGNFEQEEAEEEEQQDVDSNPSTLGWSSADFIQWVNTICTTSEKITTLSEIRKGDTLIELLEELSGKTVKLLPPTSVGSISMVMLDNIVAAFKFLSMEGIETDDQFTIKDIFSGKEDEIKKMLQTILDWSIQSNHS